MIAPVTQVVTFYQFEITRTSPDLRVFRTNKMTGFWFYPQREIILAGRTLVPRT